ncbi:divalent heavy-metal cations transporter [Nocardioides aestuarii]|uniref:ZIP family metal transporter n=1 Tax=Nocardioides aestuarii TaxID=252231 RepID=A0ABW4TTE5_9ACTN
MFLTIVVVLVVSGALVAGAAWGVFGRPSDRVEGFVVALAGGALMVSAVLELVEPSTKQAPAWSVYAVVVLGALVFVLLDRAIARRTSKDSGGGLLTAITLDGVPENLALGVALIGAGPLQVAALSGSIFLSNLPEAAGGARDMSSGGHSRGKVMALWVATAVLLSLAALAGNLLLAGVPESALALVRSFAGGAVAASLATEVFPKAFREESYLAGLAATLGLVAAIALDQLG